MLGILLGESRRNKVGDLYYYRFYVQPLAVGYISFLLLTEEF